MTVTRRTLTLAALLVGVASAPAFFACASVAVQVRSIHCRRFADNFGGSNVECRVLWRVMP